MIFATKWSVFVANALVMSTLDRELTTKKLLSNLNVKMKVFLTQLH